MAHRVPDVASSQGDTQRDLRPLPRQPPMGILGWRLMAFTKESLSFTQAYLHHQLSMFEQQIQ